MSKKIAHIVKMQLKGNSATLGASIGATLSGKVRKPIDFCNQFNARTKNQQGKILPVVISVYEDQTFDFVVKSSPATVLILKAAKIEKGSAQSNRNKVGSITQAQVAEIAKIKYNDLNAKDQTGAERMIVGTARSIGITINN